MRCVSLLSLALLCFTLILLHVARPSRCHFDASPTIYAVALKVILLTPEDIQRVDFLSGQSCFTCFYVFVYIFGSIQIIFEGFRAILMVLAVWADFLNWNREAIICATTFLLVNYLFMTNYSKRLRQPYVDLRHRVHLKHQNLISKFSKNREKICRVPDDFTLCVSDPILTVSMHREFVRQTSFEKCCTTH